MPLFAVLIPAAQIGHDGVEGGIGDAVVRQVGEDVHVAGVGAHERSAGELEGSFGGAIGLGIAAGIVVKHGDGRLPHGERMRALLGHDLLREGNEVALLALHHACTVDFFQIGKVVRIVVGLLHVRHQIFDEIGQEGRIGIGSIFGTNAGQVAQLIDEVAKALDIALLGIDAHRFFSAPQTDEGTGIEVAKDGRPRGGGVLRARFPQLRHFGVPAESKGTTGTQQAVFAAPLAGFERQCTQSLQNLASGRYVLLGGIGPIMGIQYSGSVEIIDEIAQIGDGRNVSTLTRGVYNDVFRLGKVFGRQQGEFGQRGIGVCERNAAAVVGPFADAAFVERRTRRCIVGRYHLINIVVGDGIKHAGPPYPEGEQQEQAKDDRFLHNERRYDVECFWHQGDRG